MLLHTISTLLDQDRQFNIPQCPAKAVNLRICLVSEIPNERDAGYRSWPVLNRNQTPYRGCTSAEWDFNEMAKFPV